MTLIPVLNVVSTGLGGKFRLLKIYFLTRSIPDNIVYRR